MFERWISTKKLIYNVNNYLSMQINATTQQESRITGNMNIIIYE